MQYYIRLLFRKIYCFPTKDVMYSEAARIIIISISTMFANMVIILGHPMWFFQVVPTIFTGSYFIIMKYNNIQVSTLYFDNCRIPTSKDC